MMAVMKDFKKKVKTGWPIPEPVKESFVLFCAEKGTLAQEDCAAALLIFQYLPAQVREEARLEAKGARAIDKNFWILFAHGVDLGVRAHQDSRQPGPGKKG